MNIRKTLFIATCAIALAACGDDTTGGSDAQSGNSTATDSLEDGAGTGNNTATGNTTVGGDATATTGGEDVVVDVCDTDADCDDELFCNGVETCSPDALDSEANGCVPGEAPKGTDPNPVDCQILMGCDEETDSFPLTDLAAGDACDDGIACTANDVCNGEGGCKGSVSDTLCDDGLFCNGVETCNSVVGCKAGIAPVGTDDDPTDCLIPGPCEEPTQSFTLVPAETGKACDDAVECTFGDACTGAGTCEGEPNHAFCSDDAFCNGEEVCDPKAGACVAGPVAEPGEDPDPNDCMVFGECNEESDDFALVAAESGAPCDDGVDCTSGDVCDVQSECAGVPQPQQCDNGDFCDGAETCDPTLGCQAGTPPTPPADPDLTDCLVVSATCNTFIGEFPLEPAADGAPCDDGVSCTTDACNATGACLSTAADSACDDQEFCNGLETCDALNDCQPGTAPTAPEDTDLTDCLVPTCDNATDGFVDGPAEIGAACDDGFACTSEVCDDLGACVATPDDSQCDNALFCDGPEVCSTETGCGPGTAPVVPTDLDPDDCLVPMCDEASDGFIDGPAADGAACSDAIECTADACNDAGACVSTPNHAACDNTLFCDGIEVCTVGVGCGDGPDPTPPEDADPADCVALNTCNEATDSFDEGPSNIGGSCSDGKACTTGDVCSEAGECEPTDSSSCCDQSDPFSCDTPDGLEVCDPVSGQCKACETNAECQAINPSASCNDAQYCVIPS